MKTSIFKSISTKVVVAALFLSLVISPVSASAQTTDITAQLSALQAALNSIGEAIVDSRTLSESDRYNLLTQLVAISTQILSLRGSNYTSTVDPLAAEAAKDSAQDAELERVLVAFDPATNEAVIEVTVDGKTTKTTEVITELSSVPVFTSKIGKLREIVAMKVSNDLNVKYLDVYAELFVTARDPLRDAPVPQYSATAIYLAENFAKHAILEDIKVYPGAGKGVIAFYTDQDDIAEITLAREVDGDGGLLNTYSYKYEYFINDRINSYYSTSFGRDDEPEPLPRATESASGVTEAEIKEFTRTLFNDVPFTSKISNFDSKLMRFLVENPISYDGSGAVDCYTSGDKVVVDEFIEYVVDGLEAQYEDVPSLTEYITPFGDRDRGYGCSSKSRFF